MTLVARRRLAVRRYDTDPSWLGPRKLRPFRAEPDPVVRHRLLVQARGGGTMPHRARMQPAHLEETGHLHLRERVEATGVEPFGDRLRVCIDDQGTFVADAPWCATGGRVHVASDPLLAEVRQRRPLAIAGGLPDLDGDLRWPGTNLHLTGTAAGLVLGPTAGNLIGHRRAAQRIIASLRDLDPERADRSTTGAGACPQLGSWPTPSAAAPSRRTGVAARRAAPSRSHPAAGANSTTTGA